MSKQIFVVLSLASLAFGCTDNVGEFRNAVTGEACEPDTATLQYEGDPPKKAAKYCEIKSNNGHGNNEDGVDSSNPGSGEGGPNGETDQSCDGTGDCIDDENRGDTDGTSEECELPPGCDDSLCCEPDDGGDDDGDDDGGDDEPESTCAVTCDEASACAAERSCVDGCCVVTLE